MSKRPAPKNPNATVETVTREGADGFIRTGIVLSNEERTGSGIKSVELTRIRNGKVERIALLNIVYSETDGEHLIVDVIDVDKRYAKRRALAFGPPTAACPSGRVDMTAPENGTVISVDLSKPTKV